MVVGTGATTVSSARPVIPAAVAVTSVSPASTPVTRPASSTIATAVSPDVHENSAPGTAWPFSSNASADRRSVSPSSTEAAAGDTVTVPTTWATVTAALPDAPPAIAVIVAEPLPAAVTSPDPSTSAKVASLLDQDTDAFVITSPYWSCTFAVSCTVASRAVSVDVAGVTVTVAGRGGSGFGSVPSPQA